MMSKSNLNSVKIRKVLSLPKCQVNGSVSNVAHIDICSANKKRGGIYVTVYPIIKEEIKEPQETRQKNIMNPVIQRAVVSFAKSKKNKEKAKKKPLSTEKHIQKRVLSTSA